MLYRILTEDKNRAKIEHETSKLFPGFTIVEATGCWKGSKEKSLIIEIWAGDDVYIGPIITTLAERIKGLNSQESVLVQEFACTGRLI
jgi:hypothetical protein